MTYGQILIVPAFEQGRGGGHIGRCITLVRDLRAADREALLFLPSNSEKIAALLESMNFNPEWRVSDKELANNNYKIEFIVLDRFQTPADELSRLKKIAPLIGIDEGGAKRDSLDFLIDILVPKKMGRPSANMTDPSLLKFPAAPRRAPKTDGVLKVLVTFGQEDSSGLGTKIACALSSSNNAEKIDITLLRGALANGKIENLPNVRVIESIPNLAEHLGEYDIVITHYGITAYEALYSGTMVLLASPTKYHAKLAKAAGFYTFNSLKTGDLSSSGFLRKLKNHCEKLAAKYGLNGESADLAALCQRFSPQVNRVCPVCGKNVPSRAVTRFSERTYRRCLNCGIIYMDRICPAPIEYDNEYFFESYKKQYGKTYLEDFDNIKKEGKRRAKIINSFLPAKKNTERTLLDIGCAYGPFLAAAREEDFSPAGIDPAHDAVRYVQNELGITAAQGFFPECPLPSGQPFDAVTLWFVIEHFTNCAAVLSAIKDILKPGGILAFSTPSFSGISGRSSLHKFLSASPADHFTVWSPQMCKRALAQFGFKVKKITSIGHHPERFPLFGKLAKSKKSPLYFLLLAIGKIFRLGDTFEVYAELNKG